MQSRGRFGWPMRLTALVTGFSTMAFVLSTPLAWAQHIAHYRELLRPRPVAFTQLKPGLTQTLSKAQLQALQRQQAARWEQARQKAASRPAVVPLSWKRMRHIWGRGTSYRNQYFSGTLPWQRSLRDVNICNGNLFKSFTDIQVAPGRGQGLALQRTYNSDDPTPGPFGVGWMHCYDIRNQDEAPNYGGQDDQLNNYSDRVDFFGGRHKYHRDADGLYTPPPYLYDELSSDYTTFLINVPANVLDDTDKSMDGTIKHYIANGSVRSCDYIMDRFGNKTVLTYDQTITLPDGSHPLATVTDPTGRTLTFHTANLGTATQPVWRVVQVDGPQYSVAYGYGADGNLSSVTLDPGVGHLNRTTTYTYTSVRQPGEHGERAIGRDNRSVGAFGQLRVRVGLYHEYRRLQPHLHEHGMGAQHYGAGAKPQHPAGYNGNMGDYVECEQRLNPYCHRGGQWNLGITHGGRYLPSQADVLVRRCLSLQHLL